MNELSTQLTQSFELPAAYNSWSGYDGLNRTGKYSNGYGTCSVQWWASQNKFIAVDHSGKLATSTDGLTWTYNGGLFDFPNNLGSGGMSGYVNWLQVFGNTILVGDPYFNTSWISTDAGTTWKETQLINYQDKEVFFNGTNSVFISSGGVSYSTDGLIWTSASTSISSGKYPHAGGAYNGTNKYFVIMDDWGTSFTTHTSTDAVTWTNSGTGLQTLWGSTAYPLNSSYGNGYFYVWGDSVSTGIIKAARSTDGVTWSDLGNTNISTDWTSMIYSDVYANDDMEQNIVWDGSKFVLSGYGGIYTSTDGLTWALRQTLTSGCTVLAYSPNTTIKFVTVDKTYDDVYNSTDGITWNIGYGLNKRNTEIYNSGFNHPFSTFIQTLNKYFVITNTNLGSSTDAITWTAQFGANTAVNNNNFTSLYGESSKVWCGAANGRIANSTDGISWTGIDLSSIFGTNSITNIAKTNNTYLASSSTAKGLIASSTDGITWTQQTGLQNTSWLKNNILDIVTDSSGFVLTGTNSKIASSTNAVTWNTQENVPLHWSPGTIYTSLSTYVDNKVLYLNMNPGVHVTSTDGSTWILSSKYADSNVYETPKNSTLSQVVSISPTTIVLAYDGKINTSTNSGITWTEQPNHYNTLPSAAKSVVYSARHTIIAYGNSMLITLVEWLTNSIYYFEILKSTDNGVNWTSITTNLTSAGFVNSGWQNKCLIYANGKFLLGSGAGRTATTTDGITWTYSSQLGTTGWGTNTGVSTIIHDGTVFLASSRDNSGKRLATSTDGITWTYRGAISGTESYYIYYFVKSADTVLAFADNNVFYRCPLNNTYDSTSWTISTALSANPNWNSSGLAQYPVFAFNKFFIFNNYKIAQSTDGITWNISNISNITSKPTKYNYFSKKQSITYNGSQYSTLDNYGYVATSTDKNIWTYNDTSLVTYDYNNEPYSYPKAKIIHNGTHYLYCGKLEPYLSKNTKTWTKAIKSKRFFDPYSSPLSIFYQFQKYFAFFYGGIYSTSTDGINWSAVTYSPQVMLVQPDLFRYGNGVLIGIKSTNYITSTTTTAVISTDGINWQNVFIPIIEKGYNQNRLYFGNGKFLFITTVNGAPEKTVTSTDGISWIDSGNGLDTALGTNAALSAQYLYQNNFGNGVFVVGANGNKVAISTDGISWSANTGIQTAWPTSPTYDGPDNFLFGNGRFLASRTNKLAVSTDAVTWTNVTSNITSVITGYSVNDYLYPAYYNSASNLFVIVATISPVSAVNGNPSNKRLVVSTDGITWTLQSGLQNVNVIDSSTLVFYANGLQYINTVRNAVNTRVSTDGITWSSNNIFNNLITVNRDFSSSFNSSNAIGKSRGFIAINSSGTVLTSP